MAEIVRYAESSRGTRIAYSVRGVGPPLLLFSAFPRSNLELELSNPKRRKFFDSLSRSYRLVRFDYRGLGLSDRHVESVTLEDFVSDAEAVVDALGFNELFVLCVGGAAGAIGASLADRIQPKVRKLVLWAPQMPKGAAQPAVQALRTIMEDHWELFLEARYRISMTDEEAHEAADIVRQSTSPEFFKLATRMWLTLDVEPIFTTVQCPTLVVHPREHLASRDDSAVIASMIPGAELAVIEGNSKEIFPCDTDSVVELIDRFLGVEHSSERVGRTAPGPVEMMRPGLTPREQEIISLLSQGLRSKEIGRHLGLSTHTIERHIANLYRKTGANGRVALTMFAVKHGIVEELGPTG